MNQKNGNIVEKPVVNDVEDIKTVTYFQNKPIDQQWFMVISHGQLPMLNAPKNRSRQLEELKSIAKSVQMSQERKNLMMKITNNDQDEEHSLELKFYLPNENTFQYAVDCRQIDLFRRSKKDRTFFYFTLLSNSCNLNFERPQIECQMYHAVGMSNAEFIANLMEKQVQINLKSRKKLLLLSKMKKNCQVQPAILIGNVVSEKARGYQAHQEHPFDKSLDEIANNVPTLLDLKFDDNTNSISSIKSSDSNATLHQVIDSDLNKVPKYSTHISNPFMCDWAEPSLNSEKQKAEDQAEAAIYKVTIQHMAKPTNDTIMPSTLTKTKNEKFEDDFDSFITKRINDFNF